MSENTYKESLSNAKRSRPAKTGIIGSLLKGSFLNSTKPAGLLKFLIFLTAIASMLIANTYYTEQRVRELEVMRNEVTRLRTIYITNKSELMRLSSQSAIARRLRPEGFVESTVPPALISSDRRRDNFKMNSNTNN